MAVSFSIIIPVYNKAQYVRQCLDSLLNQDYSAFEIIVINDGSTDNSLQVISEFNDKRLKVITCPNGGVSNARNIGIKSAMNDYVLFVDADDYVEIDYMSKLNDELTALGSEIWIGGLTKFSETGEYRVVKPSLANGVISKSDFRNEFVAQMFNNEGVLGYVAGKCVSLDLLRRNRIQFNPDLKLAEDLDFWLTCYNYATTLAISSQIGYYYRQDAANSSWALSPQHESQIGVWLRILDNYALDENSGRSIVLAKINGIIEASFLEAEDIKYHSLKDRMCRINGFVKGYKVELRHHAHTLLQKLLLNYPMWSSWAYLTVRSAYHSVR